MFKKISLNKVEKIIQKIQNFSSIERKIEKLKTFFKNQNEVKILNEKLKIANLPEFGNYIVWSFSLLGQFHIVDFLLHFDKKKFLKKILLINQFKKLDNIYYDNGGFFGYIIEFYRCFNEKKEFDTENFSSCPFVEVTSLSHSEISSNVFLGIKTLAETGFFILAGGKAERFFDFQSNRSMSSLEFFKKSLLERIIEDIEGLEALYERFFQKPITVPIVIMLSSSVSMNESCFSRIKKSDRYLNGFLKFFVQNDLPLITSEGFFLLDKNEELVMLPGGHGRLWHEAYKQGIFCYLKDLKIKHILIRQINNPLAGLDENLLLLLGTSHIKKKLFGVISCNKDLRYSEGSWVKLCKQNTYSHINIEYTQLSFFNRDLISRAPSNTNILYFNLEKNWNKLSQLPKFDHILNMKTIIGKENCLLAGRLECLVQDFSKLLEDKEKDFSSVIILNFPREKVISSIKKPLEKNYLETPEKAFFDYLHCARKLLESCHVFLPKKRSWDDFLNLGPEFIFDYHPSLGPIYSLIRQKICHGSFFENSIVELNIIDVFLENLCIKGHFIIDSEASGKCFMRNIEIKNKGSVFESSGEFWKGKLCTYEYLKISLGERARLYAEDLVLEGNIHIDVPREESWKLFINDKKKLDYKIMSEPYEFIHSY